MAYLQRELRETQEALKIAEDKAIVLQEERRIIQSKYAALEGRDKSPMSGQSVEQMASAIIAQSNADVKLSEEERRALQGSLEAKLLQVVTPLKHKLKRSESLNNEYKGKYRDKIIMFIDKLEDGKWLSNIILHANEQMARSDNEQLPATLIVFKEDLERKKDLIKNKLKELTNIQEDVQNELKVNNIKNFFKLTFVI